jgi:hypothetical protein
MKRTQKHAGTFDDMSEEQRAMVERMKSELYAEFLTAPEICTTWHILRFLRARDFNFDRAKLMINDFISFRKKKNFERIADICQTDERAQIMRQNYTSGHYGTDFEGRIILIEKVGGYKPEVLFKHFTIEDIEDHLIQIHERMMFIELPIASSVHKKRIDNTFLIIDMKHVNVISLFKSKIKSFVKFGTKIGQDYYPEILAKSVFINSPVIFKAVWSIISLWMDKKTVDKFQFESGNGLKTLAKYLDVTQLPVELGGQNPIPLSDGFGPWKTEVHESYNNSRFLLNDRSIEYEYYYTPAELKKDKSKQNIVHSLEDLTKSFFNDKSLFQSAPVICDLKVSNFRVMLNSDKEV